MSIINKTLKKASCLCLALVCVFGCASAETAATFNNLCYGQAMHQRFIDEIPYSVFFMGHEWSFDESFAYESESYHGGIQARGLGERNSKVKHLPRMMGDKTLSVYEYTVYKDDFSVKPDGKDLHLVTLEFDIPYQVTLYSGVGNRITGEYVFDDPVTVNGYYCENIFMPRNADGSPALVDRLYLYSYDASDETHYMALSLYIDYENYNAKHPVTETRTVKTPSAPAQPSPSYMVLMLYLDNGMPVTEEMVMRVVEAGDATLDELRVLFEVRGIEFPVKEVVRSISYQAMELYLSAGIIPPEDIVSQAIEADKLTNDDLTALFKKYGLTYTPASVPTPTPTPTPVPTPAPTVGFSRASVENLPGFTAYEDFDSWDFYVAAEDIYSNGILSTALIATGTGESLDVALSFAILFADRETVLNQFAATGFDVLAGDTVFTFSGTISDKEYSALSIVHGENCAEFVQALADADTITVRLNSDTGSLMYSIPASIYADSIKYTAKVLASEDAVSAVDNEAVSAYWPYPAFTKTAAASLTKDSIVSRKLGENNVFSQNPFSQAWSIGAPSRTEYANGTLKFALTVHGEGESDIGRPIFTAGFVNRLETENLFPVSSVLATVDGQEFFFNDFTETVGGYATVLYGEKGHAFIKALSEADNVTLRVYTTDGFVTETLTGEWLENSLKASAAAILTVSDIK